MLNKLRLWLIAALIAVTALTAPMAIAAQSAPTEGASLSGIAFRLSNNAGKEAIISQNKGSTAPSYATAGLIWLDDAATPWLVKQYDGADWITLGAVNSSTNTFTPYYGTAPLRLLNFASDTGGANVYAIAPSPAISAYVTGQMVTLKPAHANTGASTINVNGVGIKSIKSGDGSDLASGTLNASGFYLLVYDGTNFVLSGGGGVTEANISLSDVTTNNATTARHGFLKKLSNNAATYMDGTGNWSSPSSIASVTTEIFTANGTWNKPANLIFAEIEVVGGGGGVPAAGNTSGGHCGAGGGGGGYAKETILASGLTSTVAVTIGAGGAINGTGGTTSFGSYLSATGGAPGTQKVGGAGGDGSGGDINISGSAGGGGTGTGTGSWCSTGAGGGTPFAGMNEVVAPVAAGATGIAGTANTGQGASGSASGGSGGGAGRTGGSGKVVIRSYIGG